MSKIRDIEIDCAVTANYFGGSAKRCIKLSNHLFRKFVNMDHDNAINVDALLDDKNSLDDLDDVREQIQCLTD